MFLIFLNVMRYFGRNNKSLQNLYLDQFMEYTALLTTGSFLVLEQKQKGKQPYEGAPRE